MAKKKNERENQGRTFEGEYRTSKEELRAYRTARIHKKIRCLSFKKQKPSKEGHRIVFIPMHDEHDEKTSYQLVHMMSEKALVAPGNLSIEEKVTIIGQSDLLIGMRLHSLIFSAIQTTPFIAISYDPKIDAFAQIANQPNIGHVEKDNWDGQQLFDKAVDMLRDRNSIEQALRVQVSRLQVEAWNTATMALETFSK